MPPSEEQGPRKEPPHPNGLREVRTRLGLTREALHLRCAALKEQGPSGYVTVGMSTLQNLEKGLVRPRLSTARTIAAVLGAPIEEIFTSGTDDPVKNPQGNTGIGAGRRKIEKNV